MHLKICSYFSSGFILSQPFSAHCEIIAHIVPVRRTVAKLLRNIRHALLCFAFKRGWNKLCFGLCLRSANCIYHNKQRHRKANRQHRYYQFAVIFFAYSSWDPWIVKTYYLLCDFSATIQFSPLWVIVNFSLSTKSVGSKLYVPARMWGRYLLFGFL